MMMETEMESHDDDEEELSLELLDLPSIWFSWIGVRPMYVSNVSCVSRDAVRSVPNPEDALYLE